jgi:hypothetical protein
MLKSPHASCFYWSMHLRSHLVPSCWNCQLLKVCFRPIRATCIYVFGMWVWHRCLKFLLGWFAKWGKVNLAKYLNKQYFMIYIFPKKEFKQLYACRSTCTQIWSINFRGTNYSWYGHVSIACIKLVQLQTFQLVEKKATFGTRRSHQQGITFNKLQFNLLMPLFII